MQFINELFGGSSETFSDAVKVLDARTGMDSAREKIAEFAAANNWEDADNETITDFVAKIKNRKHFLYLLKTFHMRYIFVFCGVSVRFFLRI